MIDQFYELCFDVPEAWRAFQLKAVHSGNAERDAQALTTESRVIVLVPEQPEAWGAGPSW